MQASVERSPTSAVLASIQRRAASPNPSSCPTYRSGSSRGYSIRAMTSAPRASPTPGESEQATSSSTSSLRIVQPPSGGDQVVEHVERQPVEAAHDQFGVAEF